MCGLYCIKKCLIFLKERYSVCYMKIDKNYGYNIKKQNLTNFFFPFCSWLAMRS
jgi:hypothetical protein